MTVLGINCLDVLSTLNLIARLIGPKFRISGIRCPVLIGIYLVWFTQFSFYELHAVFPFTNCESSFLAVKQPEPEGDHFLFLEVSRCIIEEKNWLENSMEEEQWETTSEETSHFCGI